MVESALRSRRLTSKELGHVIVDDGDDLDRIARRLGTLDLLVKQDGDTLLTEEPIARFCAQIWVSPDCSSPLWAQHRTTGPDASTGPPAAHPAS